MASKTQTRKQYVQALREIFEYDKATGHLVHRVKKTILGTPNATGTMRCTFMGEQVSVAYLVWLYHYGKAPFGKILNIHAHKTDKSHYSTMVNGKRAISTKIEHLYDSGSHTYGAHATNPDDDADIHNIQRGAAANDTGIIWQKTHMQFKVVIRGKYVGMRKTIDEARKLKDNYLKLQESGNTRWFGKSHEVITPDQLKEAYHTDKYEYEGREYRRHAGWNKFIFGVGDNEVRGSEEQIKQYIDALNEARDSGDTTNLFAVIQELASAKEA